MEPIWGARELFHHCYNLTLSCWKLVCFDFSSSVTPNRLLSRSISSHLGRDCVRKYGQSAYYSQKLKSDKDSFLCFCMNRRFFWFVIIQSRKCPNGCGRPRVESPVVSEQPHQVDNLELEHFRSWQRWPLGPS